MKAPAAAFEQASWEVKSGRTWAPAAREGHICAYSRSIGGIVVFGGLTPGAAHSADCSICRITAATGDETSIEWQSVPLRNPSGGAVKIPRRCYHGAELRDGADGSAQLVIFGGEGVLDDGTTQLLNDTWSIDLPSGRSRALIASAGAPPPPRKHHTCTRVASRVWVVGGCQLAADTNGGTIAEGSEGLFAADECVYWLDFDSSGEAAWGTSTAPPPAAAPAPAGAAPAPAPAPAAATASALGFGLLARHSHSAMTGGGNTDFATTLS